MRYGDSVKSIYTKFKATYTANQAKQRDLYNQLQAQHLTEKDYQEQVEALRLSTGAAREGAYIELSKLKEQHAAAVKRWNTYDGSKIPEDAKLFSIPVKLGAEQLSKLAAKHAGNPMMQDIILGRMKEEDVVFDLPKNFNTADRQLAEMDSYVSSAVQAVREPDRMQAAFFEGGSVPDAANADI